MDSITTNINVTKLSQLTETAITQLTGVGLKILGAIVLFLIGRWLIRWALRLMSAAFNRQHFDHRRTFGKNCRQKNCLVW